MTPTTLFAAASLETDEADKLIREQLDLTADAQDVPRLQKLHRQSFKKRRADICKFKDGQVSELVIKFPLLQDVRFVST